MTGRRFALGVAVLIVSGAGRSADLGAQSPSVAGGISGTLLYDRVDPVPLGGALGELRLVHPVAMVHAAAFHGRLRFTGMANFEGLTLADGQLAPGVAGEGYADRRHPHTYLHEAVATYERSLSFAGRDAAASLSAGKGFAPYGTDDPMSRPILRYPVNHHLAQVLERFVGIAAVRIGPVRLEGALFNGDEPDRPGQWPNAGRFGDSRAARVTLAPAAGIELQGSLAFIASPEHRAGGGLDHRQRSLSARLERPFGAHHAYALAELARSDDAAFVVHSFLMEGAWGVGRHRAHYRFERTERPEEQRLPDPWRTPRPHHDFSNQGFTRWSVHTLGYSFDVPVRGRFQVVPVVEGSLGRVRSLTPASFDPVLFYGREAFWTMSIGVRLGWGARLHRMGRYGAAVLPERDSGGSGVEHIH